MNKNFDLNQFARLNPTSMKLSTTFPLQNLSKLLIITALTLLTGCSEGMPKLFWGADEGGAKSTAQAEAKARPVLDVPPSLRGQVSVPDAESVAMQKSMPERYQKAVAGKEVALDVREYAAPASGIFSAVVDAMTALNFPVQSVDSASGTVTTDWIRKDADTSNMMTSLLGGGGIQATRHRFVVRVLRSTADDGKQTSHLEVRSLAQVFQNRHWTNKKLKRKLAEELFSAVEERLAQL